MNNGYYTTTGAMVTQFNKLNVITNNLANINTTGFKKDDVIISDFERIYKESRDILPINDHTKKAAKFLNRSIDRVPQISEHFVEYRQGGMRQTGNALDFALKRKDAFFMIETPSGLRLTQNGSFTLDNDGILVTKEGYKVLPAGYKPGTNQNIQIPENSVLTADKNGNLYTDGEELTSFYLVAPSDIRRVQKEGDNLYKFENLELLDNLVEDDVISQGFLETSNVNPVNEMVGLIEAQRMVEMYQKVMTTHMNDLNNDAITKLGSVRA